MIGKDLDNTEGNVNGVQFSKYSIKCNVMY